ncbi:MAG: ChbG/HpnK family deacetylase [Gammaproteobacteria bacterium]
MIKIILCADDYAHNEEVTDGILQLLTSKRLTAVSCLSTTKHWPEHAKSITTHHQQADIGLHFNLTEGSSLTGITFKSLKKLLINAFSKTIVTKKVINELNAQLDQFIYYTGISPDFIDGHQHVHHFPMVRDALLSVYKKRFVQKKPYIRITTNYSSIKSCIISLTGAKKLKKMAKVFEIPHNTSFAGVYNFNHSKNYHQLFLKFLSQSQSGGIIMCHPGLTSNNVSDPLIESRYHEFNYLISNKFSEDCLNHNIVLSKFNDLESI